MKKIVITVFFLYMSTFVYADNTLQNELFAKIVHVKNNDTLNVREKADYKSKKITELDYNLVVGLSGKCKKVGKSTWCKVHELAAYGDNKEGWVNAYYLKPYSEGFVTVKGYKNNCHYALKCSRREGKEQCLIVINQEEDAKWIERSLLRGESQFGAAPENMDGYCTKGEWLEPYLNKSTRDDTDTAQSEMKNVIHSLLDALEQKDPAKDIAALIHPKQGITMTEMVRFGSKDDKHFTKESFLNTMHQNKKLFWGHTYARGDKIFKTLPEYVNALHREKSKVTKIVPLQMLKGFSSKDQGELKVLEVYWINEHSKTKEYDYLGMVVILSKYHGKWYIVGLLRDRWTI